jgi:hypothetical protein
MASLKQRQEVELQRRPRLMLEMRSLRRRSGAHIHPPSKRILKISNIQLLDPMCEERVISLICQSRHSRHTPEKHSIPKKEPQMRAPPNLMPSKPK